MMNVSGSSSSNSSSDEEGDYEVERRRRVYKIRVNFEISHDFTFKEKFRVHRTTVQYLLESIGHVLQHKTNRSQALTPEQQLLTALHWMGVGSQYHGTADMHGLSKATVHRCLRRVCQAVNANLLPDEVRWPTAAENVHAIPQQFMEFCNFPRIAGCLDGSLVPLDGPKDNEVAYVDRHQNHSLNTMMVCGPNLDFFYVSARWPGSVHDSRVLKNSSLFKRWNDDGWRPFPNAVILGDSGYPLKSWLIPPIVYGPLTASAIRFLRAHKSTRRIVECAFGVVKEKFPCLNHLRVKPEIAANIILTTVTLHNIEKRIGSDVYEPYEPIDYDAEDPDLIDPDEVQPGENEVLQALIAHFV